MVVFLCLCIQAMAIGVLAVAIIRLTNTANELCTELHHLRNRVSRMEQQAQTYVRLCVGGYDE